MPSDSAGSGLSERDRQLMHSCADTRTKRVEESRISKEVWKRCRRGMHAIDPA